MDPDGNNDRLLYDAEFVLYPAFSPAGNSLLFSSPAPCPGGAGTDPINSTHGRGYGLRYPFSRTSTRSLLAT